MTTTRTKTVTNGQMKSRSSRSISKSAKVISNHSPNHDSLDERELLRVLTEVRNGNFSVRMPIDNLGLPGKICDMLNEIISMNERMMVEFTRAGNTIGKQGKLTQRIEMSTARGSWSTGIDSLNSLISDLVHPTIEI